MDRLIPVLTLSQRTILHSSKLKEFADNNYKFDENGRNLFKRVITSNFSFSHTIFKRLVLQTCKNQGLFGKGLTHYHIMLHFDALKIYSCGKHCEKRRNCLYKQFLLFSQCFLPYMTLSSF